MCARAPGQVSAQRCGSPQTVTLTFSASAFLNILNRRRAALEVGEWMEGLTCRKSKHVRYVHVDNGNIMSVKICSAPSVPVHLHQRPAQKCSFGARVVGNICARTRRKVGGARIKCTSHAYAWSQTFSARTLNAHASISCKENVDIIATIVHELTGATLRTRCVCSTHVLKTPTWTALLPQR